MRPANAVLSAISDEEYERLLPHLEAVTLKAGEVLHESHSARKSVYFLDFGVAAMSVRTAEGAELELSIVGNESTVGERAIFDYDFFIIECAMLTDGRGHKIDPKIFKAEFRRGGDLHDIVINNLESRITEASQTSLCNQMHSIRERLARWMLTLADRAVSEDLNITHDVIRKSLGVTRSSIARAAMKFKREGLIDYRHGKISILDRLNLEKESCECYAIIENALKTYRGIHRIARA